MSEIDSFISDPSLWSEDEKLYFENVDWFLEKSSNNDLSNGKPSHAVYIINALLKRTTKKLRIFSGQLKLRSSDDMRYGGLPLWSDTAVVKSIVNFLSGGSGRSIEIVVEKSVDGGWEKHPIVKAVKELKKEGKLKGSLSLRQLKPDQMKSFKENKIPYHFVVSDDCAYRLETDTQKAEAIVNFGDCNVANTLSRVFDDVHLLVSSQVEVLRP